MIFLRFLAFIFFITVPFSATAEFDPCAPEVEKYIPISERYQKGLFFKIRKCTLEPSYISGTMHTDDPRTVDLAEDAVFKLKRSRLSNFEIKFGPETDLELMEAMYFPPESVDNLQSKIGMTYYEKFRRAMAELHPELPEMVYYRMRPWAAAVVMQEPANVNDGVPIDLRLQKISEASKIPVNGIETAKEQLSIFQDMPENKQREFLLDSIDNVDMIKRESEKLQNAYFAEDLQTLDKIAMENFDRMPDRKFAKDLQKKLIDDRNERMLDRMKDELSKGDIFIAVGALHLTGQKGLLKLLEDNGYYIEAVPNSQTTMIQY